MAKYSRAVNSVFQYSNANDRRVTQDLCSFREIIAHAQSSVHENTYIYICIYIYIPRVPHLSTKNNWSTRTDSFLNNHFQECVPAYFSIHHCLSFLHEVMIGNHRTKALLHEVMIGIHRPKTFLHEVMIGNHRNNATES